MLVFGFMLPLSLTFIWSGAVTVILHVQPPISVSAVPYCFQLIKKMDLSWRLKDADNRICCSNEWLWKGKFERPNPQVISWHLLCQSDESFAELTSHNCRWRTFPVYAFLSDLIIVRCSMPWAKEMRWVHGCVLQVTFHIDDVVNKNNHLANVKHGCLTCQWATYSSRFVRFLGFTEIMKNFAFWNVTPYEPC